MCIVLQVVVIATPSAGKCIPSFEVLLQQRANLYQKPKWAPGVLSEKALIPCPQSRSGRMPLHVRLLQLTAVACPECDPLGERPMQQGMRQLQEHLQCVHRGLQMCPTCVTARRK
jgi:hypothetical protein